ncbi:hypothetical protein ACGYU5_15355 [Burkholderia pseudomallei]
MKVKELLERLAAVNPEAEVRFMQIGADPTESDSVDEVEVPAEQWTFERGRDGGTAYTLCYPGEPEEREEGYTDVQYTRLSVVLLRIAMPDRWKTLLGKS